MLLAGALFAFGGRAALGAGVLLLAWRAIPGVASTLVARRRVDVRAVASAVAVLLIALAAVLGAVVAGVGDRLIYHGFWDASTQSRLTQWQIFEQLDADQAIFGISRPSLLDEINMLRLDTGVDVIENFALLLFVTLGLIGFAMVMAGLASLLGWCCGRSYGAACPLIVGFVVVILTSNSLARKSALLLILVATASVTRARNDASYSFSRAGVGQNGGPLRN